MIALDFFISKGKHCVQSSGDGESFIKSRCKIAGVKGNHVFDENYMSKVLSLADVADSYRVTMVRSVNDAFFITL